MTSTPRFPVGTSFFVEGLQYRVRYVSSQRKYYLEFRQVGYEDDFMPSSSSRGYATREGLTEAQLIECFPEILKTEDMIEVSRIWLHTVLWDLVDSKAEYEDAVTRLGLKPPKNKVEKRVIVTLSLYAGEQDEDYEASGMDAVQLIEQLNGKYFGSIQTVRTENYYND